MKKYFKYEKGMTLVEILAVIVIGAILMLLISGVLVGVQNEFSSQKAESEAIFDVTYAAKVITKDFRMAKEVKLNEVNGVKELIFTFKNSVENKYHFEGDILFKNTQPFVTDIKIFNVTSDADAYIIELEDKLGKKIKTELVERK